MSRAAAAAMRDLADCLRAEGESMPSGTTRAVLFSLARAHERAAERIEARAKAPEVPDQYKSGQAGTKRGDR